jgi:transposase
MDKINGRKDSRTIITIPDKLWNEIRNTPPKEKPFKTVGRPIVSFRKVMDGILYILRTGCQWNMLPREYGSGSTSQKISGMAWFGRLQKKMD